MSGNVVDVEVECIYINYGKLKSLENKEYLPIMTIYYMY